MSSTRNFGTQPLVEYQPFRSNIPLDTTNPQPDMTSLLVDATTYKPIDRSPLPHPCSFACSHVSIVNNTAIEETQVLLPRARNEILSVTFFRTFVFVNYRTYFANLIARRLLECSIV